MQIRKTELKDLDTVMDIFDTARAFMRANGNTEQWPVGTPSRATIEADIAAGNGHVVEDEDGIQGTFAFILGGDPTYNVIEGAWRSDTPYGTIHRVASAGKKPGVTKAAFGYGASRMDHLRIDTHADNKPMQNAIKKFGFEYAGVIHLANGDPRYAYDWLEEDVEKTV